MRIFRMILSVTAENLTTVLEVLKDSADLISMEQVDGVEAPKKSRRGGKNRVRGKDGITSRGLIVDAVSGGQQVTRKQLMKLFKVNGFAETSAGPAVNELVRDGKVKKIADGVYSG